jgi:hypothetical protein
MRVKGGSGSIYALGDNSTFAIPKAQGHADRLFDAADMDRDGKLNMAELKAALIKVRNKQLMIARSYCATFIVAHVLVLHTDE